MNSAQFLDMLRTARMQARLAVSLYEGRNAARELASNVGGTLHWIEIKNMRAAAIVFRDHVHLSVCGSNDAEDWRLNCQAEQIGPVGSERHQGFAAIAKHLNAELHRNSALYAHIENVPLVIGGHSAGGAVAQLLALEPVLRPREIITFGCPRVLSPGGAAHYKGYAWRVRRFVMPGDPVPNFPLRKFRFLFGRAEYAHTSDAMCLFDDGSILLEQEGVFRRAMSLSFSVATAGIVKALQTVWKAPNWIRRKHAMERYAIGIDKAIERASE